jgi:hypothetical protein
MSATRLEATIDQSVSPSEVQLSAATGDVWKDFGYWLEALAVMGQHARDAQGWDNEQILDYIQDYLRKALGDFELEIRD